MTSQEQRSAVRERLAQAAERGDAAQLVQAVSELCALQPRPGDVAFAARHLSALGAQGAAAAGLAPKRVFIARSVTVEPLLPYLQLHAVAAGLWLELAVGGYGSFAEEMMSAEAALARFEPDLVLFIVDNEDLAGDLPDACAGGSAESMEQATQACIASVRALVSALRQHSPARLLMQGLMLPRRPVLGDVADANMAAGESRAVRAINDAMAESCRAAGDAVLFDPNPVAARCGWDRFRDERMFRLNRLHVAGDCLDPYARAMVRSLRSLFLPARKVLCTDLDNTLWGGIVGEDGPDGIAVGSTYPGNCYQQYQRYLKQLASRGVLLTIASKNNPEDVKEAFERRKHDMLLTLDDFVSVQIGWESKVQSIRAMAKALSLGIDSFVFVDDSEQECAEMRQALPEVLVVNAPASEPWRLLEQVARLGAFDQLTVTPDDRRRVEEYRAQGKRAALEADAGSREQFLASLGIVCTALSALDAPLSRTAQLLGKTNQFNLTTRRHSAGEIERMAAEPGAQAWALRVRDRFGDAGVVGVALAQMQAERCVIDTFLLSCRVIGRGVESALLWHLAQGAREAGATVLVGEYIPTKKNKPCADLYSRHGFAESGPSEAGGTLYELDLQAQGLELPPWITFEQAEGG